MGGRRRERLRASGGVAAGEIGRAAVWETCMHEPSVWERQGFFLSPSGSQNDVVLGARLYFFLGPGSRVGKEKRERNIAIGLGRRVQCLSYK